MKFQLTATNTKGQLVIPKPIRDLLGINQNTILKVYAKDGSVVIDPISKETVLEKSNHELNTEILKKTRGAWTTLPKDEKLEQDKEYELKKTEERRKAW